MSVIFENLTDQFKTLDVLSWEHPLPDRLRLNATIFFAAFLCSAGIGLSSPLKGRARIAYTACCIHAVAGFSYFLLSNNYVPLIETTKGRPLVLGRLFEWMVTVPLLLSLIAWLIDPDCRRVAQLRGRQLLCLITGGIGPVLRWPVNWFFFCWSCYLQVLVLWTLHQYFTGMQRKLQNQHDRLLVFILHVAIFTLFTSYTFFWLLAVELNLFSLETEMWVFANFDITTKLILTSVLSNLTAAAYDYDFVEFPRYFKDLVANIGVPVFGVSKDGTIACWNMAMEVHTGLAAGNVLYEKIDRCNAFSEDSIQAIRDSLETPQAKTVDEATSAEANTVNIEVSGRSSNPQDAATSFYVLNVDASIDSQAPQTIFIEASSNAHDAHQALAELAQQLYAEVRSKGGVKKNM